MTALLRLRVLGRFAPRTPARVLLAAAAISSLLLLPAAPAAAGDVTYHDVTALHPDLDSYHRVPSETLAVAEELRARGTIQMEDIVGNHPIKPHGAPGLALLDHDLDGDLDVYATNGPGVANSLFSNRLAETGELAFVDVASAAGVGLADQDSTGVCFGDLDNDGDPDLYVLGRAEPNRLFENRGDGTFTDVTAASGVGGGDHTSTGCSMADFDGDGLLDVVVGNSFDMSTNLPILAEPFALNEHNLLFMNRGDGTFEDASDASGIGAAQDITWALAAVDLNQDGHTDVVTANDQGAIPGAQFGGVDRGFLRYLVNDGTGHFTDVTTSVGLDVPGDWMGLSFADFDGDGRLDLFGSNSGDWFEDFLGVPSPLGLQASRWYLQQPDGTFDDPGVGGLVATGFGWGTGALDFDNDGDSDVVFYGGLDAGPFVESSNPGSLLENDGAAGFSYALDALLADGADHALRLEHGLAVGDLNRDGHPDVVSISSANLPTQPIGPIPYPQRFGSPIEGLPVFFPSWLPGDEPGELVYSGVRLHQGTVALELSSGDSGNGWIAVSTRGSVGDLPDGRVNRDGIGAVLSVTPEPAAGASPSTAIRPVLGGSSYASQHALETTFGLGRAPKATVEVLWPGGVRNRVDGVRAGERIELPEIPCSFDDPSFTRGTYARCVRDALDGLEAAGVLDPGERGRFLSSALRAFAEHRR